MPHLAIVIEFDQSIQNTHVCVNVMEVVLYMITTFCALALNTTLFNLSSLLKNVFKIMIVIMIMYSWYGGRLKFSNHRGFCKNRNVKYLKGISEETSDFRCNDKKLFKMYKVFNTFNICIFLTPGKFNILKCRNSSRGILENIATQHLGRDYKIE